MTTYDVKMVLYQEEINQIEMSHGVKMVFVSRRN